MTQQTQENTQKTAFYFPRLSEYADAFSRIMRELKNIGASPGEIIGLLKGTPGPPDGSFTDMSEIELEPIRDINLPFEPTAVAKQHRQLYTAQKIARMLGVYSIYGLPHALAMSAILNHNMILDDDLIEDRVLFETNNIIVYYTLYDERVVKYAKNWIESRGFPYEIEGRYYTYNVLYRR